MARAFALRCFFRNAWSFSPSRRFGIFLPVIQWLTRCFGTPRSLAGSWHKTGFTGPISAQKQRRILEARGRGWEYYSERVVLFCKDNIEL
jgi:hypothetical protein